ncbi:MAG: sulfur carrier protein ThiS [Candidatus Cloacimonetes bacterium]|jgi:sulfur carrier protein|nr:sulfur carrier protein ThiS [Candidatus Cloacimonadota bacterium]MDD4155499.1 sulfur carrier protein ThiS [Candidatus Cloacimonadota bacterium]
MKLKVNGNIKHFDEEKLSISELLNKLNYTFPKIIVKINNDIISKKDYDITIIKDNDIVLLIHMISGG